MASEYSRELSAKVSRAHLQQARLGFSQGGPVPYGVRRLLLDKDGEPRCLLGPGEQKGLAGDRVLLVPGPPNEIELVRRIFNMFVAEGQSMAGISVRLNKEGVPSTYGYLWTTGRVASLLKSELMIGYYVYQGGPDDGVIVTFSIRPSGRITLISKTSFIAGINANVIGPVDDDLTAVAIKLDLMNPPIA
ncbi:recombinase family protein [Mesorhizobium sp. M0048]